ncbi:hypothetical protein ACTMUQ_30885 [Streptomyces sp. SD11]|uniref:hypothetical protein n=1 Tax=Streptomyces sp. SD11 TaxID=3452209 RepID=UPI003F88F50E
MNDFSTGGFGEVTAADIAQLLYAIDRAAFRLGFEREEFLDVRTVSAQTGIWPNRVRELLGDDEQPGAEPQQPPRTRKERETFYRQLVGRRLDLLRKRHALDCTGPDVTDDDLVSSKHDSSYRTIGDELDLTHSLVADLANGEVSTRPEYSHPLEERYRVEHGYLSKTEGRALADYLTAQKNGLLAGAVAAGMETLGGKQVAFRRMGNRPPTLEELLETVDALVARTTLQRQRKQAASDDAGRD